MKVTVNIGGIGTSPARMRALALVREAVARREAEAARERRSSLAEQGAVQHQHTRGK